MRHILVSLDLGTETVDVAIPSDLTPTDIVEWLTASGNWNSGAAVPRIEQVDGDILDGNAPIVECGVVDGTRLAVRTSDSAPPAVVPSAHRPPSPISIPERLTTVERIRVVVRALVGGGDGGRWQRAVNAWEWTDHERRLSWLIGRPRLMAGVVIRVTGHRSAELAGWLASAISSVRSEQVVVVEPSHPGARSQRADQRPGGIREERVVGTGSRDGDHSPEPGWTGSPADRLILIEPSRVTDGATATDANRQTVVSAIRPVTDPAPVVVAWWGEARPTPALAEGVLWTPVSEDPITWRQLAAVLAGDWR